jgi:hypothetical protein
MPKRVIQQAVLTHRQVFAHLMERRDSCAPLNRSEAKLILCHVIDRPSMHGKLQTILCIDANNGATDK